MSPDQDRTASRYTGTRASALERGGPQWYGTSTSNHCSKSQALQQLEQFGYSVVRLKNYWPRNDNYSGVNGVLTTPEGIEWELQFHTSASLNTQDATHAWYEEFRRANTPIERSTPAACDRPQKRKTERNCAADKARRSASHGEKSGCNGT